MVCQKRNKIEYQEFTQRLLLEIVLKTYESYHISKGKDLDKIVKNRLHPWQILKILPSTSLDIDKNTWIRQAVCWRWAIVGSERRMGKYHGLLEGGYWKASLRWDHEGVLQSIEMEALKKWLYKQRVHITQLSELQKLAWVRLQ